MTTELNHLINVLKEIEASDKITKTIPDEIMDEDGGYHEHELPELVQKAILLANVCLITNEGRTNFQNIGVLRKEGFNVSPGETDSFGWLSGIIHTRKGQIVFG